MHAYILDESQAGKQAKNHGIGEVAEELTYCRTLLKEVDNKDADMPICPALKAVLYSSPSEKSGFFRGLKILRLYIASNRLL